MKKRKLKDNVHYRARWGNFKSDKWKKKSLLISEITDLVGELYHPSVSREEIIELKNQIKRSLFSDADEKFKVFTTKQMHDFWTMNHTEWKAKWGDKI